MLQLLSIASHPIAARLQGEPGSVFSVTSHYVVEISCQIPLELSALQTEQTQLSEPLLRSHTSLPRLLQ